METKLLQQMISTGPAEVLIASIWQGLLLTAFAWACLKLAPGLRASTRFTLWLIVFLLVALLPCFAVLGGSFNAHPLSSFAHGAPQASFALHLNPLWAFAIELVWVLASLLSLGRLIAGVSQMRTLFRGSTPIPFSQLAPEIQSIVSRIGDRPVAVRLSEAIDAPSVLGFFRPAVVVPRGLWNELAPGEQQQIILHEVAHLERGDDWTNLLQKLFRSLCPLNPALVWAERHLCIEREQACDDAVLDAAGNARAYATCLTRLAESRIVKRAAALAPGLWRRHSELARRVENILHRRPTLGPAVTRGLVAASLLLSLSGALVLQRCPGMITFANHDAFAADTVAASTGSVLPVRYENQSQARYQDAVFHPAAAKQTILPLKGTTVPAKPHRKPLRNANSPASLRWVEMRTGEGFTLILFTVNTAQDSSTTDNWIAFQI